VSLVFAVVAAILLGSSDFCAARASRHEGSFSVTRMAVLVSAVLAPLLLLVDSSTWMRRDITIAALAGVFMMGSLALLYRGYSVAPVGIVGPTASVLIALVPLIYDVGQGLRPGPVAWIGIVFGLCALGLTSYSPGGTGSPRMGALLGVVAGIGFGVAFILMSKTSDGAGLMPVLIQRTRGESGRSLPGCSP
jgi:drug/metabolite transporter (DMT)-like permease